MKKIMLFFVAIAMLATPMFAIAADEVLQKEIKQIAFRKDKNGNDYARIIVNDSRNLNGVVYEKEVAVMAFGDMVKQIRGYKQGQTIKAVVSVGEYRGDKSYRIIHVVK